LLLWFCHLQGQRDQRKDAAYRAAGERLLG
jgi:hypothetical protein